MWHRVGSLNRACATFKRATFPHHAANPKSRSVDSRRFGWASIGFRAPDATSLRGPGIFVGSDRGFNPSARRHVNSLHQTNCSCPDDYRGGFTLRMRAGRTRWTIEPEQPHLRGRQSDPARRCGQAPAHVGFVSQGRGRLPTTTQMSSLLDHVAAPVEVTHASYALGVIVPASPWLRARGRSTEVVCAQHTYDAAQRSPPRWPSLRSSRRPFASLNRGAAA